MSDSLTLPRRVIVSHVLNGRYAAGFRPVSWDERKSGVESIVTVEGESILLYSNGGQSTPNTNWELLLIDKIKFGEEEAFTWTLYGLGRAKLRASTSLPL